MQIQIERNVKVANHSPFDGAIRQNYAQHFLHEIISAAQKGITCAEVLCFPQKKLKFPCLGTIYIYASPTSPAPPFMRSKFIRCWKAAAARFYFHCLLYISAQSSGRRPSMDGHYNICNAFECSHRYSCRYSHISYRCTRKNRKIWTETGRPAQTVQFSSEVP